MRALGRVGLTFMPPVLFPTDADAVVPSTESALFKQQEAR